MNAKEAKKTIPLEKLRLNNDQYWWYAKGYLECLEGEEVKELVEALIRIKNWSKWATNQEAKIDILTTIAEVAISKFNEKIK